MDTLIWTVTNLIANFILPPTLFFGLMAIGLWQGRRKRWARWLTVGSLIVFVLLSVNAISYLLAQPFETASPPLDSARIHDLPRQGAMIVVLGGGRRLGAIEYPGGETLGAASLERSRYGARLAKATGLPLSVSGGKPGGGNLSEAALMQDFIETELNHPVAIVEDQSFDTRQNAEFMLAR
ncbi:MAG: YdcF family protein, partial [Pseudomonadota bacterium]